MVLVYFMFMQIYTYLLTYLSKLVIIHIETGMHSKVGTALGVHGKFG